MDNSISKMRPELVSEWSSRNLPLTPDEVPFGSNKMYWWTGPCGHEWQTSAKARSAGENVPSAPMQESSPVSTTWRHYIRSLQANGLQRTILLNRRWLDQEHIEK